MEIKSLKIEGYKSLESVEILNPNPFTVFVGPNASGKSNIFEALEFMELCDTTFPKEVIKWFGGEKDVVSQFSTSGNHFPILFNIDLGKLKPMLQFGSIIGTKEFGVFNRKPPHPERMSGIGAFWDEPEYVHFTNFTRLFVGKVSLVRRILQDDSRLNTDASNLEKVLKRILKNENIREEIMEILQLLIPGFESVEIKTEEVSGTDSFIVRETNLKKPLHKGLISDGTYNILAIIAALYQSDTPQFLCIEEPENGINPFVVKELVTIIRNRCKEKGHYVWLNTHSQTLVSKLKAEEIILVDKVNGLTQIKQIQEKDLHGLPMDEALFTNVLGGGIPW